MTEPTEPTEPIEPDDPRRLIASRGEPGRRYAHLEPIVEAELSWGNRVLSKWGRLDPLLDDRSLSLTAPFHLAQLRETFRFPPTIRLSATLPRTGGKRDKGRMVIADPADFIMIYAPLPEGWTQEGELPW
jgi:hypothetical protein